ADSPLDRARVARAREGRGAKTTTSTPLYRPADMGGVEAGRGDRSVRTRSGSVPEATSTAEPGRHPVEQGADRAATLGGLDRQRRGLDRRRGGRGEDGAGGEHP